MDKVTIELDLSAVQDAIKAEVRPAVRAVLAQHHDVPAMIADALLKEPPEKGQGDAGKDHFSPILFYRPHGKAMVEELVYAAIKQTAEEYIKTVIDERRDALYAAFRKMMAVSPDRLVNTFVGMIEGADISLDVAATLFVKKL